MPGPDDRDTVIDHDEPRHATGDDRWSPGGPPPEPGWYEDPWNARALRRWDGHQWTGETAPKDSTPPAAAPAPPPPPPEPEFDRVPAQLPPPAAAGYGPPPAAPPAGRARRRLPNPLILAGVAIAVVVVGYVVMTSGGSGTSNTATSPPPAPTPTIAKSAGLTGSVLAPVDLGTGWTETPPAHALTAAEYTSGPCGSPLWAHNVAGYQSSFVNGATAASAHGAVVTKVFEAPSLVETTQQQTFVASVAYAACLKQTITDEVRSQLAPRSGQSVTTVSVTPFTLGLSLPSHAYVVSVTVAGPGAASRQVTVNAVAIFSGRYEARLDVSSSSDAPLSGQIVQQQAANEATHLASLS